MHITCSIGYVDTPERRATLAPMLDELLMGGLTPRIVLDATREGCWPTIRRAILDRPADSTHHMILQDDVQLCRGFVAAVNRLVAAVPYNPIWLIAPPRRFMDEQHARGTRWVRTQNGIWGQGVIWPVHLWDDFLAWEPEHCDTTPANWHHDDWRYGAYLKHTQCWAYVPLPGLVQHVGKISLLKHPWKTGKVIRQSRCFIGDGDPLAYDWTQGLDEAPAEPIAPKSYYRGLLKESVLATL